MRTPFLLSVTLTLVAAGGLFVFSLHRANAALRTQLNERGALLRTQAAPAQSVGASLPEKSSLPAPTEIETRLIKLRAEIAALEQKSAVHGDTAEITDAPSTNRDPEKGMTRLEYMRNVGQATPAAAMQTLFWAALKGDEAAMARTIVWEEAVRPKVQALIDRLPAASRERYSTPELLAALSISQKALDVSAIYITETVMKTSDSAVLTVKGLTGRDEPLAMRLGPAGWQYSAGESWLARLTAQLAGKSNLP
jgi:hypothetical protein